MVAHPPSNPASAQPTSSPISLDTHKCSDANRHSGINILPNAEKKRENMMKDARDTCIRMTLSQFRTDYLSVDSVFPLADDDVRKILATFRKNLKLSDSATKQDMENISEKAYSASWEKVFKKHRLCPGYFLHLSENRADPGDEWRFKVDGSLISQQDKDYVTENVPYWPLQKFCLEWKSKKKYDCFVDTVDQDPTHAPSSHRRKVFGQLMSYADRVFHFQHRTALFMFLITGNLFRIMRWDRSGVIVAESIDYLSSVSGMRALLQVLHSLSCLSPQELGMDLSAQALTKDTCGWKQMDAFARPHMSDLDHRRGLLDETKVHPIFLDPEWKKTAKGKEKAHGQPASKCHHSRASHEANVLPVLTHVRELFRQSLVDDFPRYQLCVGEKRYLVGKPVFTSFGLIGRGTRGYVALEWETWRFVWLKDAWRPHYEGVSHEGLVLKELNGENISSVPTVIAYGDVPQAPVLTPDGEPTKIVFQETETSNYSQTGPKEVDPDLPAFCTEGDVVTDDVEDAECLDDDDADQCISHSSPDQDDVGSISRDTERSAEVMETESHNLGAGSGLRHLVHTRLVVKEVCLPFEQFINGHHLVQIVYDSANAHKKAYEKFGYLHRDVSTGNILIYPHVVKNKQGQWVIAWTGFLVDWEMAKKMDIIVASQPCRTGTWHFLSRHLLDNPDDPSTVTDEVESFTHTIVNGASRFIRSNMPTIDGFMDAYFSGFMVDLRTRNKSCPTAKFGSLEKGVLDTGKGPITFYGTPGDSYPLNKLLAIVMQKLHVRYAIQEWQTSQPEAPKTPVKPSQAHAVAAAFVQQLGFYDPAPEVDFDSIETFSGPKKPTSEMLETQELLKDHQWFLDYLLKSLYDTWPAEDKVEDRMKEAVEKPEQVAGASAKRRPAAKKQRRGPDEEVIPEEQPPAVSSSTEMTQVVHNESAAAAAPQAPVAGPSTNVRRTRSMTVNQLTPAATASGSDSTQQRTGSRGVGRTTSSRGGRGRGKASTANREDAQEQGTSRGRKAGGAATRSRRK